MSVFPETEEEIRQLLIPFYKTSKCNDPRPAKYMKMQLTPMPAFQYILETFLESRTISSKTSPFRGQTLSAAKPCPEKWSIQVKPPPAPPATSIVEFQETSNIETCSVCNGDGKMLCGECKGAGALACPSCAGRKYGCTTCKGSGLYNCKICSGLGWVTCSVCEGEKKVVRWSTINVNWFSERRHYITPRESLTEQLAQIQWPIIVSDEIAGPDAKPVIFSADQTVTATADQFLAELKQRPDLKVIKVRQTLLTLPVMKVDYTWKYDMNRFYVYSMDKIIYFPDKIPGNESCGGCCCCGDASCAIV